METWLAFQNVLFWFIMALIWWVWVEYRKYSLDKTRQRLFVIRDQLFINACEEALPFDSEAYRLMRDLLNRGIRYTERLTIYRVAIVKTTMDRYGLENSFSTRFSAEMKGLDADQKRILTDALKDTDNVLIHHLVHSNLLLLVLAESINTLHLTNKKMLHWRIWLKNTKKAINNDILIDEGVVAT